MCEERNYGIRWEGVGADYGRCRFERLKYARKSFFVDVRRLLWTIFFFEANKAMAALCIFCLYLTAIIFRKLCYSIYSFSS